MSFEKFLSKLKRVKRNSSGWTALCPAHDDKNPSLSVGKGEDGRILLKCFAGCETGAILAALGLTEHDLFPDHASDQGHEKRKSKSLTLGEYADAKRLPVDFLRGIGVEEIQQQGKPALKIIYRLQNGSLAPRQRIRTALRAKEGSYWDNGKGEILPYGLDRLREVRERGYVVLVEGESDAQTLWSHGEPALGIPGATMFENEWAAYMDGIPKVYAVIEPDEGGRKFRAKALQSPLRERLWFVRLPDVKDVSELHCQDPANFPGQWSKALSRAIQASECTNIGEALDRLVEHVRRYMGMTESQARVVSLWTVHTHCFQATDSTLYLSITSPEKRSGKSLLLEILEMLVFEPWLTGRVTPAVLPRRIEALHPTLLLDESDAAFASDKEYSEALRGVLNSGYRRGGKYSCCVGQGAALSWKDFSVFCPKAIAGIGKLPDTVADRSIPIRLKRATAGERIQRFRRREVEPEAAALRGRLEVWGAMAVEKLREARPALPAELTARQQDGAELLLAIADAARGEWPQKAREALIELCGEAQAADDSIGVQLLRDIEGIFSARKVDRLPSAELAVALIEIEGSPWGEWTHGKPLTASRLARLLKRYDIAPGTIRVGEATPKGYMLCQFEDTFKRYSSYPPFQNATPPQPNVYAGASDFSKRNTANDVAAQNPNKSNKMNGVADVAVSNPPTGTQAGLPFAMEGEGVAIPKPREVEWEA